VFELAVMPDRQNAGIATEGLVALAVEFNKRRRGPWIGVGNHTEWSGLTLSTGTGFWIGRSLAGLSHASRQDRPETERNLLLRRR
jgi:hypothetical protein